ncbi:hypothetical protein [Undibacterium sp. Ren11W]|uniref:hypothetical protein n=1 Tax=Undibacterium sp. Ren11W TaxID=3413045 RepID=UPI003BF12954
MKEYKEFPPVLYLFLLPLAFGGIWLGSQFVILGLIYWLNVRPFIRRTAIVFAVWFICMDLPLYFEWGMAAPIVIMFQLLLIFVLVIVVLMLKLKLK